MPHLVEQTPYEVLEVPSEASADQIDAAYLHMTSMVADDSLALYAMMGEEEAAHIRALVEEAYALLSDPERRQSYDLSQKKGGGFRSRGRTPVVARLDALAQMDESDQQQANPTLRARPVEALAETQERSYDAHHPQIAKRAPFAVHPAEPLTAETLYTGALLRQLRESAGATLFDLSDATKVGPRYLTAIENDQYDALPAAVYVRGFITQYARTLGLNPQAVATSYMQQLGAVKKR